MRSLTLALLAALAAPLAAQPLPVNASAEARTEGFFISPRLYAASLTLEDADETDGGGGLGLRLGYGFNKTVAVFVAFEGAGIDSGEEDIAGVDEDYGLGSFDLGAQFSLLPSNAVNPFLRVGLNGTAAVFDVARLDSDDDPRFSGGGLTLGGGAEFRLSDTLGLEAALDLTGGQFNEIEGFGFSTTNFDEIDFGTARLGLGLVWRP